MNLLDILCQFAIAFIAAFFMVKTVSIFLAPANNIIKNAIPYFLYMVVVVNKSWIGDENPLILFPFFVAVFLLCYQGFWYARLVISLVFFSLVEPLCMMLDSLESRGSFIIENQLAVLLAKLFAFMLIWLLARRIAPKNSLFSAKLWALLGCLASAPLFSTLSFTFWNAKNFNYAAYQSIATRIAYTILPFTCLSALALLVALALLAKHEALERAQKLAEVQEAYYKGLEREQRELRRLRHDMHNHIIAAKTLLEQGGESAKSYLQELESLPEFASAKRYCENDIANALISSKADIMKEKMIDFDAKIALPSQIALPNIDLCSLLGNALDNAIEAAEMTDEKDIILRVKAAKNNFMMQVKNSYKNEPLKTKSGTFISGKKDKKSHGYGMEGMREISQKHGGMCEAEFASGKFSLVVNVPLR